MVQLINTCKYIQTAAFIRIVLPLLSSVRMGLVAICLVFFAAMLLPMYANASGLGAFSAVSSGEAAGNNDGWRAVVYGAGRFVAVGSSTPSGGGETVMTSLDGLSWATTTAAGNNDAWKGITYGAGRFVAVGSVGDRFMHSTNGLTWTVSSVAGDNDTWRSVAYGAGRFVAVASGGSVGERVAISSDGVTWATTTAAGNDDAWFSVTYGNGRFVAVGNSGDRVMTSTNGITWATTSAAGNDDEWYAVTYGNGRFVAVGANGDRVMYSDDGLTWATTTAAGNDDNWFSIEYGNGRFVAAGSSGDRVMTSTDGINWTAVSAAGNNDTWFGIEYALDRFVVVGDVLGGGDKVMTATSTHPISQTGFRFRDDDGNETGATYVGAQNANTTAPVNDPLRLRTQLKTTDEMVANQYYVQYKKTSDTNWNTVGVDGTFPYIVASTTGRDTGNATSRSVTLPTCEIGNLLLVIFSSDGPGVVSTASTGWQKMGESANGIIVSGAVFWKMSETSNSLSISTAASEEGSYIVYCIRDAGTPYGTVIDGSSTNSNPPLIRLGAVRNTLWIATRSGDAQVAATVAPTGYRDLLTITANTTGGATTNAAHTYIYASTTDPGTFTSATEQWVSWTIAVPPKDTPTVKNLATTYKASTTGANDTTYGSIAWSNPTYATSSNNVRAAATLSGTTATNHLYLTNWGFSIPDNATIQGVEVFIEKIQSGGTTGNARDNSVRLVKNGTTTGSINLAVTGTNWITTERVFPYGSSTAMWGLGLTPADVNASNFGVAFAAAGAAAGANRVVNIDHASLNVYYTVPSAIILASSTHIASGGASTTGQLIAPGVLATTSFVGGHITDDQNVTPIVNTAVAKYTELEWNLIATGTATTGDAYQLRTASALGEPLGEYHANALWTLGTNQTPGTFTLSGNLLNAYGTTTNPGAGVLIVAAVNQGGNPVLYSTTTSAGGEYTFSVATGTSPGTSWNTVTVHGDNDMWRDVTYGNGRFVAVGGNTDGSPDNYLMYSDDGITWASTSASNNNDNWGAVTFGGGRFVAIANYGGGPLIYSDDGITWTDSAGVDLGGSQWLDVTYGNGRFVAVGNDMPVAYSLDGDTWATTTALGNNDDWLDVTYGNGRFVAVGDDTSGDGAMYSNDGITWTVGTISGSENIYSSVTYGQGRFVAGAGYDTDGPIMYSDDGITWTKVAGAPDDNWDVLTYGNGRFVAASENGQIMHSPNGIDWTLLNTVYNSLFTGLAYGNGRFVAVGCGGNAVCGTAGIRTMFSDAGLGIDTGYTIYSKSSVSPATTFLMGVSGASTQRADLFKNTLAIYNATSNVASSTTHIDNAAFFDAYDDVGVLYEFTDGAFTTATDLVVATGTTDTKQPLVTHSDVFVYGTFDLGGAHNADITSLTIANGATFRAPGSGALAINGDYTNNGTASFVASSTVAFSGQMPYRLTQPHFIGATSTVEVSVAVGVFMSDDGQKLYVAGQNEILEYTLDTPYDVRSGALTATAYPASIMSIQDLAFADGGRKMYVNGWGADIVDEFTLTIPWDLSTAVFTASSSFGGDNFPSSMFMSEDGQNFYLSGSPAVVRWYRLTTPYSIQSAVLQASTTALFGPVSEPFWVSADGRYLIRPEEYNFAALVRYRLLVPWDITTATIESGHSGRFNIETFFDDGIYGLGDIWMSSDGTKIGIGHSVSHVSVYTLGAELSGNMVGTSSLSNVSFNAGKSVFMSAASTTDLSIVEAVQSPMVVAPTTTLSIAGNLENHGVFEQMSHNGTVYLTGSNHSVIGSTTEASSFNNLIIAGHYTFPVGTTTVRDLTINEGATLTFTGSSTLEVFGNYTNYGTSTLASSTVVSTASGYDLRDATHEQELYLGAQTNDAQALAFSATGSLMYIFDNMTDQILAYGLSVPWEISTASYLYATSVAAQVSDSRAIQFKPDGTRLFVANHNPAYIVEYALATAWDIRTASFYATSSVHGFRNHDIAFSADGTKLYSTSESYGFVTQYTLTTPWDLDTQTFTDEYMSRYYSPLGIVAISPDGKSLFHSVENGLRQYKLLVPHNLETIYEVGDIDLSGLGTLQQMTFNASGTKMYVVGYEWVDQFDLIDRQTFAGMMTGSSSLQTLHASGTVPLVLADAVATAHVTIAAPSLVFAPTSTLSVGGNFENHGTFIPRGGTTTLSGTGKTITGNLTSWDSVTNSPDYGLTNITGSYTMVGNSTTSALTIANGAALTAPSNGSLVIAHDFTNNGTYTHNGATTTLGGNLRSAATGSNALGNTVVSARSQAGEWQALATSSALGNNDNWNSVTYGNGRFVAVGGNTDGSPDDFVMYSDDALNWTPVSASSDNDNWVSVAYGNGLFVASAIFGGGPMMTSPDGITWTDRSSAVINESQWMDITYGNGRFVAVGAFSGAHRVMYSNDGITWATTTAAGNDDDWFSVTYGNGRFVAVGDDTVGDGAIYSYDGVNWSTATIPGNQNIYGEVTYGNGRFVAAAAYDTDGPTMYSDDGITWTKVASAPNYDWDGLDYGNGRFVAVSSNGRIMDSFDGVTWNLTQPTSNSERMSDVAYGNGRFVAVACGGSSSCGTAGDRIFTSVNTTTFNNNASTTNLTIAMSSTLNASGTTISVAGNYTNSGTLSASTSTFIFDGASAQVATGTLSSLSKFYNLNLNNTSGNGTAPAVTFGAPVTTSGTMTMVASTSAAFLANATVTFQQVDWQGGATSSVWLRSTASGTQWYLDIPGAQLNVEYVNVQDSNASSTVGGINQTNSTDAGNNANWNFSGAFGPQVWNATDWTLFDTITIQEENVDADLTDFPVYVSLNDLSSTFWSTTPSSSALVGTDIRVTTVDNVEVPRELVFASSTAQTGELHFKAPNISSTTDTVFKIWYNGTTAGDYIDNAPYGAESVWSNNYVAVLHLQEDGNTTAGGYQDATGNGFDGTGTALTSTSDVSGKVGNAQDFDGTTQFIDLAGSTVLGSSTMSAWVNVATFDLESCDGLIFSRGSSVVGVNVGSCFDGARVGYHWDDLHYDWTSGPSVATNQWSYIALAVENATATAYNNLTSVVNAAPHSTSVTLDDIRIGEDEEDVYRRINGSVDEVRIASTSRSTAWIKAEYYNQSTTTDFYAVNQVGAVGSSTILAHTVGQVVNAFSNRNETNAALFAFRLQPNSGVATVTNAVFALSGAQKINAANFSNLRLLRDTDNDGQYDGTDVAVGGVGSMVFGGQSGTITFSDDFLSTTTQNYIVVGDFTTPANGSFLSINLLGAGLTIVDATSTQAVFAYLSGVQHHRNNKGGGGGSIAIGGGAPIGDGDVGGGGNTGGEVIGNDPDYFWPSSQSGSWTSGASAYDQTDSTYATTNSVANHQYADHSLVVPGSNTVQGIIVKLELSGTTGAGTVDVQLSWDGGNSWTGTKSTPTLTTADAVYTLGSPSDLWGRSWSTSDFSNANFRIRVIGNVSSNTIRLDAVQVRVYHTAGGGGGGGGGAI